MARQWNASSDDCVTMVSTIWPMCCGSMISGGDSAIEAALIIGIVLGAVSKIHRDDLKPAVWYGTLSAVAVAILTGVLLTALGMSLEGKAEEIFEGITMLIAAGILTWMIFWMATNARHIRNTPVRFV